MKKEILFSEKGKWKDDLYELEVYSLDDFSELEFVNQVQAVCFLNSDEIVFYKNKDGWLGNPGGTVEEGESIEEALKRELIEEAQLELVDWKTIGFEKVFLPDKLNTKSVLYFLRVVAKVKLIDAPIKDPDGKAVGRVVVGIGDAVGKLGWGEKGKVLIELAKGKYSEIE